MIINNLNIFDFRIIENSQFEFTSGINLISGSNGMGKTSILEAIYLLGRGKSFRQKSAGHFIRNKKDKTIVTANLTEDGGVQNHLGIERSKKLIRVRKNKTDLKKRSDLIRSLPLVLITPQSHLLIEGSPDIRRQFIDHSMFHVKQLYHSYLARYSRVLKQRNASLRMGQKQVAKSFNNELIESALLITKARQAYFVVLQKQLDFVLIELQASFEVILNYKMGWPEGLSLDQALEKKQEHDLKYQNTSVGPHRSDLQFIVEDALAETRLSRGQQKLLIYALKIAQLRCSNANEDEKAILIIDDIGAEFDQENIDRMINLISGLENQVIVTSIQPYTLPKKENNKVFHVKHGKTN